MSRTTGRRIGLVEHLVQSIGDIVTTPIGSRVARRQYGSLLPFLIDQPDNAQIDARLYSAIASALMRWEPRLSLQRVSLKRDAETAGRAVLEIDGALLSQYAAKARPLRLTVPLDKGGRFGT
ncbi:GPW/gp25 family protein [Delftia tsuruhatensis]|uniref:GPW/gp25 family protein n=1 Tax=Delftia tsuruhatensis TaxID=180282 RepID=UPI0020907DE6|nr:GPW/gp25 family protein [Delftia tsuruhatensis]MCO5339240.1 GPW/gp25 family protein [Delftia tsuruhatensis]MCR4546855.1 GPW/gp25 family protein [Delftia tsuruhatensis]